MSNRLFIRNLKYELDSKDLAQLFSSCGEIVNAKVITDKNTGKSRGFGFVTFSSHEDMNKALQMNGTEHEGRTLEIVVAEPKGE